MEPEEVKQLIENGIPGAKIEVVDIRPLRQSSHENIKFIQADLMYPQKIKQTDSLSCFGTTW